MKNSLCSSLSFPRSLRGAVLSVVCSFKDMPRTINWSREKQGLLLSFSSTHDLKYTNVFHFTEYKTYLKHLLKYRFVGLIPGSSDSKAHEFLFLRSSQGCYAGLNVLYHTHHLVKKKKKVLASFPPDLDFLHT